MSVGEKVQEKILAKATEFGNKQKSEGQQNKEIILEFLIGVYPEGKSILEIIDGTKFDRERKFDRDTVYEHLGTLLREKRVEKTKVKGKHHRIEYRVIVNNWVRKRRFARIMRPIGSRMIYPIWLKPDMIAKHPVPVYSFSLDADGNQTEQPIGYDYYHSSVYGLTEPEHEFYKTVCREDVTISTSYCKTKFGQKEEEEKYIFEFVNRVGAFITYIFIESLKAMNGGKSGNQSAKLIIDNAIDLNGIFRNFQNLFLFEKKGPEEISNAFRKVYPAARILEKYWSDRVQLSKKSRGQS